MKVAILQSNYIPWKGYFELINQVDTFIFYDTVKYTKNDWRNRNVIYTKNGKQWITIPIAAANVKNNINEVVITDQNWQTLHYKSLYTGYKSAPHFSQLEALIEDYLVAKKWEKLSDLNQYLIKKISEKLGINTTFKKAEEFNLEGDRVGRLVSLLQQNNATHYLSGPAAKGYMEGSEHLFKNASIALDYITYGPYAPYNQLSQPFENAASIVDLIANLSWEEIPNHIWKNK